MLIMFGILGSSTANIYTSITAIDTKAPLFTGTLVDPTSGNKCELSVLLKGSEGTEWEIYHINKIGRLVQGVGTQIPTSTNKI